MTSVEESLSRTLAAWAAGSVAVGAALSARSATRGFGRQTLAWGAVDGAIAAWGAHNRSRTGPTDPERLRKVLLVNTALDVGYVATGVLAMTHPVGRRRGWRGDGAAVVVQGAFLLLLDGWAARALSPDRGRWVSLSAPDRSAAAPVPTGRAVASRPAPDAARTALRPDASAW